MGENDIIFLLRLNFPSNLFESLRVGKKELADRAKRRKTTSTVISFTRARNCGSRLKNIRTVPNDKTY